MLQVLLSGLLLGGIYACIGTGFSLITGVMRILNFSHGSLVMLGAFVTYWLWKLAGVDPFLSIPVTMLVMFAVGYLLQKFVINSIVRAPTFMTLILTYGLDMVLVTVAMVLWTGDLRSVTTSYAGMAFDVAGLRIPLVRLVAFAAALILTALLYLFISKTRLGRAISATRMDNDAARLVGVNISRVYSITFGIGAAMAGAAGALLTTFTPVSPTMGTSYAVKAFAVCILGGFGNMAGALVGGLLMGVMENVGTLVIGARYQEAISFAILIAVLLIRPLGIMGKEYY